jgi:DNA-binding transcriptional LysR family regulator
MHLELLRLFRDLAELQSFTRTAVLHHYTPGAVTHAVHSLERLFRVEFIQRTRRSFQLTAAGAILRDTSRDIGRLLEAAKRKMEKIQTFRPESLELAACHRIALHHLPETLRRFQQTHPLTEIQVQCGRIEHVHRLVRRNVVDLGLVAYPQRLPGLAIVPYRSEPLMLTRTNSANGESTNAIGNLGHPILDESRNDAARFEHFGDDNLSAAHHLETVFR